MNNSEITFTICNNNYMVNAEGDWACLKDIGNSNSNTLNENIIKYTPMTMSTAKQAISQIVQYIKTIKTQDEEYTFFAASIYIEYAIISCCTNFLEKWTKAKGLDPSEPIDFLSIRYCSPYSDIKKFDNTVQMIEDEICRQITPLFTSQNDMLSQLAEFAASEMYKEEINKEV